MANKLLTGFELAAVLLVMLLLPSTRPIAFAGSSLPHLLDDLEKDSKHVWDGIQKHSDEKNFSNPNGADEMELYIAISNFANSVRIFHNLAENFKSENLRGGVKFLIDQAISIDGLMNRTRIFGHLKGDWNKVQNDVRKLAKEFKLEYKNYGSYR